MLDDLSKKVLSEGIGAVTKQAKMIDEHEEGILWERGMIGTHSLTALLMLFSSIVVFICTYVGGGSSSFEV